MHPQTPTIEIHFAHDDEPNSRDEIQPLRSPYSPKCPSPMAYMDSDADDFRPVHLLPPPTVSPVLRPKQTLPTDKKGIDQERFAQLLKSSRDRATSKHGRKESLELRKQVTLKAHTTKALERRALFLSKIQSPPSPTSVDAPATPPESPAIFHFTLPSPGMHSPLAVFEKLAKPNSVDFPRDPTSREHATRKAWVEEVDFKARARSNGIRGGSAPTAGLDLALPAPSHKGHGRRASAHGLPSLDQITARLAKTAGKQAPPDVLPSVSAVGGPKPDSVIARPRLNLPTHRRTPSSPLATVPTDAPLPAPDNSTSTAPTASRLPPFLQKRAANAATPIVQVSPPPQTVVVKPTTPVIRISSPPLRRRPSVPPPPVVPAQPFTVTPMHTRLPFHPAAAANPPSAETRKQRGQDMVEKLRRRSSAPAALPRESKPGHRVLSLKGGF